MCSFTISQGVQVMAMCNEDKTKDEREEFEQDVDLDTTFSFPQVLSEHNVLGKHLIIAPEQANWLVCDYEEYVAFCLFRDGRNIQEVEALLSVDADQARLIVSRLIAQIFGKEFLQDVAISEESSLNILLRLTDGCNLRCKTCLFSCTVAGPNECTFEHWKGLLDALKNFGVEIVTLTGGEPMFNPDCIKIVQYAKKIGFKILLLTNGTLITKKNAQVLCENCNQIRVSIDGPDAETHDSVRGKGMFDKVISALMKLSVYPQCYLTIAMTPTPATMPSFRTGLRQFSEWVRKEIRSDITFEVAGALMEGRDMPPMSKAEQFAFLSAVRALCNDQLGTDFIQKMDAVNIVPNRRVLGCGMGGLIPITANGDVELCAYSPGSFGNIKEIGDGDGKAFLVNLTEKFGKIVRTTTVEMLRPCSECDLRYFCGGNCRKDNVECCGDPNVCECDESYRKGWYEELVRINPYMIEPLTDLEERR
ncbi:MAG: Fe-S oxidoreductase [Parcubacteria group bacterium LiPW_30]|nr:MAG: Fe-S oxidoreductase [Parcubacteria group bacterium LiPW_30]